MSTKATPREAEPSDTGPGNPAETKSLAIELAHKPSPISRVDDDVLREIINWTVVARDEPWPSVTPFPTLEDSIMHRARAICRLVRVCRRFRDIVYGHAVLWAGVAGVPKSENGLKFILEKARQVPLAFVTPSTSTRLSDSQHDFVMNHLERVRTLCAHDGDAYDWIPALRGQTTPSLTALYLDCHIPSATVDNEASPLNAPRLQYLAVKRVWIPIVAPQLRELSLRVCSLRPPKLLDVLSTVPLLKRLSLFRSIKPTRLLNSARWTEETGRVIRLPHLERIILHEVVCDTVIQFLDYVVVPAEAGMDIQLAVHDLDLAEMRAMSHALRPFLSCPIYDSIRIREYDLFDLFSAGSPSDSPRISIRVLKRLKFSFQFIGELASSLLPRHVTTLDLGLTCESELYDKEVVQKSLLRIAPSIQTLSIEVRERLELSFLTDELSWLKFPALRTLKINWLDKVQNKRRGGEEWDGLRAWMKRAGAKQLDTLYLDGWKHSDDNWCLARIKETLKAQKSKCTIVDDRGEFHMLINYEPLFGPPRTFMY